MALIALTGAAFAGAGDIEAICLDVSEEWGAEGDVAGQCACLGDIAEKDPALDAELHQLIEAASTDEEAYEQASPAAKAAMDACSVDA
jgi:hypothetical protein